MICSSATNAQMLAHPAASSDLKANDANVYHLVGVEEGNYKNLETMKR